MSHLQESEVGMALIVYNSGVQKALPHEQAVKLWKSLHYISRFPEVQQVKLREIKAVFLNHNHAPDEYIYENLSWIIPFALNDWIVDRHGKPKRPGSYRAFEFARKWGLWENGRPSDLVSRGSAIPAQTAMSGGFKVDD